jgi:7,8-dihydropterin-6-yl-methyl-4-(beta-D-ribofuranosyl)aminobenzene 5'-phosphate synthase
MMKGLAFFSRTERLFVGPVLTLALSLLLTLAGCRAGGKTAETPSSGPSGRSRASVKGEIVITIVYDNNAGRADLTPAWGFGCVVQGLEKTILFDTGGDGRILLANMRSLGIKADQIDAVVISHIHGDHAGGLDSFLSLRPGVPVFIPAGFPESFKRQIRARGSDPAEAEETVEVCPGAKTTGTLGKGAIEEHGLCVKAPSGWVLITGCAHPGVGNMAAKAKAVTGGPIELAAGGFHMGSYSKAQVEAVIDRFRELGVERVAPCHCSGDGARQLFAAHYGQRCTLAGVGSVFRLGAEQ